MSDGDRPRIGPPVIHITPPEELPDKSSEDTTDEASGRFGFRGVKSWPEASPVMRRKDKRMSEGAKRDRHVTLIEGRPSTPTGEVDTLRTLPEDDYASPDTSDVETATSLKPADIRGLEQVLSQLSSDDDPFTPDQLKAYAKQLHRDIDGFKKVASRVKRQLPKRKNVDEEVKKTILEQCDKVSKYCSNLSSKLDKVESAAKKGHTSLAMRSGAGLNFKAEDLGIPKGKERERDLIHSAGIVCDAYKQLLSMSKLWKMEWPSFLILTGFAATYAGIDIKSDAENLAQLSLKDDASNPPEELVTSFHEVITWLREQESLCRQLQDLSGKKENSDSPGVNQILGTIFPDEDSLLEPMPMDYYYAMGGRYAQKNRPMDFFDKRLERVMGQVSSLRREAEHVWRMISEGKHKFVGSTGTTDIFNEHDRIKNLHEKLQAQWAEDFPSVQRIYTEYVVKRRRRKK